MATIETVTQNLAKQIDSQFPEFNKNNEYTLQLDSIEKEIYLTSLLINAFNLSKIDTKKISSIYDINVKILLNGNYNIIRANNYFPRSISANLVKANYLIIEDDMSEKNEGLLELSIFQSCIKKIKITTSINSIYINSELVSDSLEIRSNGINRPIVKNIFLKTRIISMFLNMVKAENFYYNNTDTDLNPNEHTNIFIQFTEIQKVDIVTESTEKIIFFEASIDILNIKTTSSTNEIKIENSVCEDISILTTGATNLINLEHVRKLSTLYIEGISSSIISLLILRFLNLSKDFQSQITNHHINRLIFFSIINRGEFILSFIEIKHSIEISSSLLGNCTFVNSKLVSNIIFHSSNIELMKFINTNLPEDILENSESSNSLNFDNKIEGLRQLRIIAEKSGNKELAIKYRSKELNSSLSSNKISIKEIYNNFDDKITIYLNKVSNNHGDSWIKTLKIGIIYGVISYSLFVLSLHYKFDFSISGFSYLYNEISIKNILKLLNSYKQIFNFIIPGFLYPTKSKVEELCLNLGFVYSFNDLRMVSKFLILVNDVIVMPYLIYQGIAAFRKHSGK